MVQTTIDQYYKVTGNKKSSNVKNTIKESSNRRSPIGKIVSCLIYVQQFNCINNVKY